ncbi:MAG: hypothetical protein MZU97_02875 [Bacillus subtilis]|nr:hypothetical protein [Bacillus subtilis]
MDYSRPHLLVNCCIFFQFPGKAQPEFTEENCIGFAASRVRVNIWIMDYSAHLYVLPATFMELSLRQVQAKEAWIADYSDGI